MKNDPQTTNALGELLALCRELKGMTLRQVEKKTGLSNAVISQYENGHAEPGLRAAIAICDCYGLTLDRLAEPIRKEKLLGVLR